MPSGDCFESALEVLREHEDGLLCHGVVLGQGPLEGKRFWHAWVEIDMDGLPMVIDNSNDGDYTGFKAVYYKVGKIRKVYRFSLADAYLEMARRKHYGPWVDNDNNVIALEEILDMPLPSESVG